jgi:hypothetical protein
MKKTLLVLFLTLTSLGVFAQTGIIKDLSGTVELKSSGAQAFVPANPGDLVAQTTIVSTGFKSTALITVGSATITVRPLTRLSLAEIRSSQGAEEINVNLQAGRVRIDVKPPAGTKTSFVVQSPVATASVRGTTFDFDIYNLRVNEGTVAYQGKKGGIQLVSAGSDSTISGANGKAADPIQTGAGSLTPPAPGGPGANTGSQSSSRPSASSTPSVPSTPSDGDLNVNVEFK